MSNSSNICSCKEENKIQCNAGQCNMFRQLLNVVLLINAKDKNRHHKRITMTEKLHLLKKTKVSINAL